jgi:hypothetical protein
MDARKADIGTRCRDTISCLCGKLSIAWRDLGVELIKPRKTVYLVSCVGMKRAAPAAARDLYISPWFVGVRDIVERTGSPWFILSAEYGLISPEAVLAPYERTLNIMGKPERRDWATRGCRHTPCARRPRPTRWSHNADIAKVQEWLGHANVSTTRLYDQCKEQAGRQSDVSRQILTKRRPTRSGGSRIEASKTTIKTAHYARTQAVR